MIGGVSTGSTLNSFLVLQVACNAPATGDCAFRRPDGMRLMPVREHAFRRQTGTIVLDVQRRAIDGQRIA